MNDVLLFLFVLTVGYAVIGNAVVYVVLARRKVPVRFMWAGTPTYLYKVCVGAESTVGAGLRRFAFTTNVVLVAAFLIVLCLAGTSR
jgi:hypothetical protein